MFFEAVYFRHFLSFYTMQLEPPKCVVFCVLRCVLLFVHMNAHSNPPPSHHCSSDANERSGSCRCLL